MAGSLPLPPYPKPYLDVQGQVALLKGRGMSITDDAKAATCLERIGYYRLSGYWYPFRSRSQATVSDDFQPGTDFSSVHDLYVFDKRLRLLMLDAIERVEVGLRVSVALTLGKLSPTAHRNPGFLDGNFTRLNRSGKIPHQEWLNKQNDLERRSSEDFVSHFRSKYSSELPLWIAIELWDFGMLSRLLGGIRHSELSQIAQSFGVPRRDLLTTWARSMNHVRNICAHHGRLWNRSLSDQPKRPMLGAIPLLDHLASNAQGVHPNTPTRLYAVAAILQFLLRTINPTTSWPQRLQAHLLTLPKLPGISEVSMGFPPGWRSLLLWRG